MHSISYFSSFSPCRNSSARLSLDQKSAPTLELNEENIRDFQHTSSPSYAVSAQPSSQEIRRFLEVSYFFKKRSKPKQKNLNYTEILRKLESRKLINFNQLKKEIFPLIKQEKNYFLAKEGNIKKYFYSIENNLTNLWGDIAVATDGFKEPAAFTSIRILDNETEAWLDVKEFRNAAIKELLSRFTLDQFKSILTNLSLDQLTDLIADTTPISLQSEQSDRLIDQDIYVEIVTRLFNSLQEAKNILSHLGLRYLGKPNLPYWQATLAVAALNPIRKLIKTAETLRTLTQRSEVPLFLHTATYSLYEQLLTDLKEYKNRFHIQALQELKQALQILQECSSPPLALNQQMLDCWRNLCERMAMHFHHTLISNHNAQDIVHSIHDLLLACTELSNFLGIDASFGPLQNFINRSILQKFIDHSIKKLTPYQRNQLANKLTSAPIDRLKKSLSSALQLEDLNTLKSNNLKTTYLDKYPLQQAQIQQILNCLQIPFKRHSSLPHFSYQLFNYFFAPQATDYLNAIRDIFKIDISIPNKAEQKQPVSVRVLRGDVPAKTIETIQELLQKAKGKEHLSEELMKNCQIDSQYVLDATRGAIRNSAFNGKRVFSKTQEETTKNAEKRKQYIVASLLRNFCGSDQLTSTSAYLSQTPYNLIDRILPINEVVTLPGGKPITALSSKDNLMTCNVTSPTNRRRSAFIEITFESKNIKNALTDEIEPTPLKSGKNYLRWNTTLEVNQDQVKLAGPITYEYALTPKIIPQSAAPDLSATT